MKKFLATTAALSLPAFALAQTLDLNNILGALGGLAGPILFFLFLPWLILIGLGAWLLFRGGDD